MDFEHSEKTQDLINQVRTFIDNEVVPAEHTYHEQLEQNPWKTPPIVCDGKRMFPEALPCAQTESCY